MVASPWRKTANSMAKLPGILAISDVLVVTIPESR